MYQQIQFYFYFLFLQLVYCQSALSYLTSHSQLITSIDTYECLPCVHLQYNVKVITRRDAPPCLHAGQPIFEWPNFDRSNTKCNHFPWEIRSNDFSFDAESGLAFAKYRICFFRQKKWTVKYEFRCSYSDKWNYSIFVIRHKDFETQKAKRVKRWLQRRNSKHSPIHFQEDRYATGLPEDAPIRTFVLKVEAKHEKDRLLYYSLSVPEDSRSFNLFALDTITGQIRVSKNLDRETLSHHVLKVTAYEQLDPSVSASCTVVVDLIDVQDNAPVFERNSYFSEIRENAPIGTTVMSVFARDLDDGVNGEVDYRLEELELFASADKEKNVDLTLPITQSNLKLLSINSKSGVIQTVVELDRETISLIRLKVVASDHGTPVMSSSALIELNVLDTNDNAPNFLQFKNLLVGKNILECEINIPENITTPAQIMGIKAEDADAGANGKVHYSIVTSSSTIFSIDYETGVLFLRQTPDPHQSPLSLLIRAKDSGQPTLSVTTQCTVNVMDVNDHEPKFLGVGGGEVTREIFVEENVPIGHELGRLFAVDEDSGQNGEIRYFLKSIDDDLNEMELNENQTVKHRKKIRDIFHLEETNGVLTTKTVLDRELRDNYRFNVVAQDSGNPPLRSVLEVFITVKDVNDNFPKFSQDVYNLRLPENLPRGKELLKLRAVDADLDQKLIYRIEYMTRSLFALINLGDQEAILSLTNAFLAIDKNILVIISATDQGGLHGRCNVSIEIEDINRAPIFSDNPFTVRIPENSRPGFHVIRVKAIDEDRAENSKLQFVMDTEEFSIDENSGLISVAKELDREQQAVYFVNIFAKDNGTPPLNASTALEIVLDDVNDNVPKFLSNEYYVSIFENTPVGNSFFQMSAVDADEGANSIIDYFLDETNKFVKMDKFRLDQTSGTLRINQALDRETNEQYILPVIARDRGQPSLSARTLLTVDLKDVNDNAPKFQQISYDFFITENSPAGTVVGKVWATDPDLGENAIIKFKIFGGPDAKLFEIVESDNETGVVLIQSREEFDYELLTNKFFVELQASSDQLSSTVPITIYVSDVNDNPPQLKDFIVLVTHFEGEEINTALGNIPAFDADFNATLEYFMESNALINTDSFGVLTLNSVWHRQIQSDYKVCVSDGPNIACAKCKTIYVNINKELLFKSVSVEIIGLNRLEFLDYFVFQRFLAAISKLANDWLPEDVNVFSVQEFRLENKNYGGTGTGKLQYLPLLNVSFFVTNGENYAFSSWRLEEAIVKFNQNLTKIFGYSIRLMQDDLCRDEPCSYFQKCRKTLKYVKTKEIIETDNFLMHSINTIRTFSCDCLPGFTTVNELPGVCNQRLNLCYSSPCLNNGTCVPLENSYRCECSPERTGNNCEYLLFMENCFPFSCYSGAECRLRPIQSPVQHVVQAKNYVQTFERFCELCQWRKPDTDEECRLRSVSFDGDGYLVMPLEISRMDWQLKFQFSTIALSSVLIQSGLSTANENEDFLEVYIRSGLPGARLSLGGTTTHGQIELADWHKNRVNDGEWHTLLISFSDRKLRLVLDNCDAEVSLGLNFLSSGSIHECAAESEIILPSKCLDPAVPCNRFLDLPPFIFIGGRPATTSDFSNFDASVSNGFIPELNQHTVDSGFVGCVRNVYINSNLVHFSDFETLEKIGTGVEPGCQKYRPDKCASMMPCTTIDGVKNNQGYTSTHHPQVKCIDKWLGHLCKCPQRVHSEHGCQFLGNNNNHSMSSPPIAITFLYESFVKWRLMDSFLYPFTLYFEFRTRERKTQLIALEFEVESQLLLLTVGQFLLLTLENGQVMVHFNSEQYIMPYPQLADGIWHSIFIELSTKSFNITVDYLYKKHLRIAQGNQMLALSAPQKLYSGLAPSTSHPQPFLGCLRNIELSGTRLRIQEQLRTKLGCVSQNACVLAANNCPETSRCHREWDRHTCQCLPGYVGDLCVDVCTVKGVCGKNGICVRSPSNATRVSYDCICAKGRMGANCEHSVLPQICPKGWFGVFPNCKHCECAQNRGFLDQCDLTTGECICRPGTYLFDKNRGRNKKSADGCVPCECGYGTMNGTLCDPKTGQCRCVGEASGRRCDRCLTDVEKASMSKRQQIRSIANAKDKRTVMYLDPNTLMCIPIQNRCPSIIEYGIQWQTTMRGATARQTCPAGQLGIATRRCNENNIWLHVDAFNCTLPQLYNINLKLDNIIENLNLIEITRQLLNVSQAYFYYMSNRNFEIILNTLLTIIRHQKLTSANKSATEALLKYPEFIHNILSTSDRLIELYEGNRGRITDEQFYTLLFILNDYGLLLAEIHARVGFLKPFVFLGQKLIFSINSLEEETYKNSFVLPQIIYMSGVTLKDIQSSRKAHTLKPREFDNVNQTTKQQLPSLANDVNENRYNTAFYMIVVPLIPNNQISNLSSIISLHKLTVKTNPICKGKNNFTEFLTQNITTLNFCDTSKAEKLNEYIHIVFSLAEKGDNSWKFPECVRLVNNNWNAEKQNAMSDTDNIPLQQRRELTLETEGNSFGRDFFWSTDEAVLVALNKTHATCQFHLTAAGMFAIIIRPDEGALFNFSLARDVPYMASLCAIFALFLCIISLCTAALRRGICIRFIRCSLICVFIFNASAFFFLQNISVAVIFCPVRNAILTLSTTSLFAFLFIYAIHIYRILIAGTTKSCIPFSFVFGVFLPVTTSIVSFLKTDGCEFNYLSIAIWPIIVLPILFCFFSFYAIFTSTIVSLHKKYDFLLSKFSIKKSLFNHSILIVLCVVYNTISLLEVMTQNEAIKNYSTQTITNILMVFVSIHIFLWINIFSKQSTQNETDAKSTAQAMWVDDRIISTTVPLSEKSPKKLLTHPVPPHCLPKINLLQKRIQDGKTYEGVPNEWIPDVMSSETYIHHTLQRSLQIPQILSPLATPPHKFMTVATPPSILLPNNCIDEHLVLIDAKNLANSSTPQTSRVIKTPLKHYVNYGLPSQNRLNYNFPNDSLQQHYQPHHNHNYFQTSTLRNESQCGALSSPGYNYNHYSTGTYNSTPKKNSPMVIGESSALGRNNSQRYNIKSANKPTKEGIESISKNSNLKFSTTIDDEMNDAYYTYTAKRSKHTPATTFN